MDKWKEAEKDYLLGMKYKDIASKYEVSINTVKSWKSRHGWQRGASTKKSVHTKSKKVAPKIIDELEANSELNDKQKLFCLFYLQRFNATWAYQKAYKCNYSTAQKNSWSLMANQGIRDQLNSLKKQQSTDLYFDINDIVREFRQQSKSDIRDVVDFQTVKHMAWTKIRDESGPYEDSYGSYRLDPKIDPDTGKQAFYFENRVKLHDSDEIDTSNIKSIRIDKGEAVVEMYDKQKALDSLMKYADIYTSQQEETNGVQILDDIEGDDEDGTTSETQE
ncbi:terminase small subunit [Companilactobacillus sp. FL22-1]|uniref:terminase small subunit n=1 Tax=Companilactobacillus sp. FL22-1 TaxID=3373892 RepID=UPI003754045A